MRSGGCNQLTTALGNKTGAEALEALDNALASLARKLNKNPRLPYQ
jgi:hypothetical protein